MQRFKDILCVAVSGSANEVALNHAVALADNNQLDYSYLGSVQNSYQDIILTYTFILRYKFTFN